MLHAMGKILWPIYSDITVDLIYNMDEVWNDTTKHRKNLLKSSKTQALINQLDMHLHMNSRGVVECVGI